MKNMKQKWTSARAEERQTGNGGPVRRPNHFCIMKDYWGDATGMNNRPHLSTEDTDTIAAAREASGATSLPSSPDSRSRRTVAKGFSERMEALAKGLAQVRDDCGEGLTAAVGKQTNALQEQGDRANAQSDQLVFQMQTLNEQLRVQNEYIRELLQFIRHEYQATDSNC
ncbi:hypothetical protein F442_04383 [Phytophthora nicotianae P10297]|uniref:Uncharacterized protein n=2 Tax=Phytophthora nicotianae TaxID=4792 RepID=W2PDN4_PHYN3|nr:hypothetical protein PPTG_19672 [Phytophthora nicotianae INRA-310]ETM98288.1 hypothetical protein PPTG_19672 [Phytophthora nicotianae INRA-310]ETP50232.1 hypothetical protein F442_04383 [Phytophthora nicotianae P10297]